MKFFGVALTAILSAAAGAAAAVYTMKKREELEQYDYDFDDDEENPFYEVTCDSCGQKLNVSEDVLLEGEIECPNCGENLEFDFSELFSNEEDDECDADCASCGGCSDAEE